MPEKFKISKFKSHPTCAKYDIDSIEQSFMKTELYSLIEKYPNIQPLNKPSLNDGYLNGTYCSSYNYLVRTQGLSIWGQPGGRPVRSKLDSALKDQMKQRRDNLKSEDYYLFPSSDEPYSARLRQMWKKPEKEKKEWLKAVLAARKGAKSYKDYEIPATTESGDVGDDVGSASGDGDTESADVGDDISGDEDDEDLTEQEEEENADSAVVSEVEVESDDEGHKSETGYAVSNREDSSAERARNNLVEADEDDEDLTEQEEGGNADSVVSEDERESDDEDPKSKTGYADATGAEENARKNGVKATTNEFDDTHAVFLISFGREAAESTLVERCILSLRRRGAWDGYIVLLTDAPPERYQNEWEDNVIVMHPLDDHLNAADGTPLKFTRDNTSLKPKRFKTFMIDYIDMDKRLDSVELIYYLDIDIMAGDAMSEFFAEIERKYDVSSLFGGPSKLYFFTPLSNEWPLQGGTFIVKRKSSRYCLELWRKEIDDMTISGRGRDQDGLRNIYDRIQIGQESRCQLVRMENEHFIVFPTPRTWNKLIRQSSFPSLIHISNSVFAKWIDEEEQTKYIGEVLQLTEEEKQSGKYGKTIVHAKKSDM